ncbi:hypothetical protein AB6A40_002127 [Gnathostoma spinigerum]|uniref:Uncharacterized protein n=1 Tax=Gnathostoma spinigerum TaxID=75299 RepID=A0ABD6EEW0_9BILA
MKISSNDSLSGYEGPSMGEPGRPGTRDLDFSIRRLNIRMQVERQYARFRREHGLPPTVKPFYSSILFSNKRQPVISRTVTAGQQADNKHPTSFRILRQYSSFRVRHPRRMSPDIGLLAALHPGNYQGIVMRSSLNRIFQPPRSSTPSVMHGTREHFANGHIYQSCESATKSPRMSFLIDTLGLCVPRSIASKSSCLTDDLNEQRREDTTSEVTPVTGSTRLLTSGIVTRAGFS